MYLRLLNRDYLLSLKNKGSLNYFGDIFSSSWHIDTDQSCLPH